MSVDATTFILEGAALTAVFAGIIYGIVFLIREEISDRRLLEAYRIRRATEVDPIRNEDRWNYRVITREQRMADEKVLPLSILEPTVCYGPPKTLREIQRQLGCDEDVLLRQMVKLRSLQ